MAVYTKQGGKTLSFRLPEPYLQLLKAARLENDESLHKTARGLLESALLSANSREVLLRLHALEQDQAQLRVDLKEGFALLLGAIQGSSDGSHAKHVFEATFAVRSAN